MASRRAPRFAGERRGALRAEGRQFRAGSFSGAARSLVHHHRRAGVAGWTVNAVADALIILARTALALVIALGLVALAVYAAAAQIGQWCHRTRKAG